MAKLSKKRKEPKKKISVTIDADLYEWLEGQIESKRFGTKSHGVEVALKILKKKIEDGEFIALE